MVDVLASVFKPDLLCPGCDSKFTLVSKRRKCAICSTFYLRKDLLQEVQCEDS